MFPTASNNKPREQLFKFLAHLSDAAVYFDRDLRFQYYNPSAEALFHLQPHAISTQYEQRPIKRLAALCKANLDQLLKKGSCEDSLLLDEAGDKRRRLQVFISVLAPEENSLGGFIVLCKENIAVDSSADDLKNSKKHIELERENTKKKEIIKAIIEAQEKERTQISYELHEQLSQNLATCKLLLDGLHLPDSKEEEKIRLKSSMKLLLQTMNEIRSISHQLNATALKMVGLTAVISDMISSVNQNWEVEVQLQTNGFSRSTVLPKDIEVSAFRVFQEGIKNIIRHSGATQAYVQITKKPKWLILSIQDNGKGFDPAKTPYGLGFTNIANRVQYHDGHFSILSTPDQGCTLEIKLPIPLNN